MANLRVWDNPGSRANPERSRRDGGSYRLNGERYIMGLQTFAAIAREYVKIHRAGAGGDRLLCRYREILQRARNGRVFAARPATV